MKDFYAAIDANLNRSMEGLRVCEDICRFALHDEKLSTRAKEIRHRIALLSAQWGKLDLLSARDVDSDPIKYVDIASGHQQESLERVFVRNLHRSLEALRSLEESSKLDGKDYAAFQALRFSLYAFEKEVIAALSGKRISGVFHNALYAILDPAFAGENLVEAAGALIEGGARIVQLRMKDAPGKIVLEHARAIASLCKKNSVTFIINDRPDIAAIVDADGVHVGQDDMSVFEARKILGIGKIVGKSTHSIDEALAAQEENPDYIAIGPVFDTSSKYGNLLAGIGLEKVKQVAQRVSKPLVAIGGITLENVQAVKSSGIVCVAVMSFLFRGDVARNCQQFVRILSNDAP